MKKRGVFIFLSLALAACSATPPANTPGAIADIEKFNAGVASDLQKIQPILIALEPAAQQAVDLGLAISGNGELVPVNNAGAAVVVALQKAAMTKSGLGPGDAAAITNAAALGLQMSVNGKYVPVTPAAGAVLTELVNQAVKSPGQ